MGNRAILEAHNLYKEYEGETIIADCDFALEAGELVVLRGESGAGKSTLLSLLGLLLTPSAGYVSVDGQPTDDMGEAELAGLRGEQFGFVFQHTQLIGSLRVIDNVLVPAMLAGRGDLEGRAADLLGAYGLSHRVDHFPHQISVGQKRRVALARAQLLEPPILLVDEPTNDLDSANAATVCGFLRAAADAGQGVLIATHDDAVAGMADRVITLKDGDLI